MAVPAILLSFGLKPKAPVPLSDAALVASFEEPSAEWRGKPFWSWNGKLEKDELLRQVGVFKDMGFGGYFMHSRVGLDTEYLGEEWFDMVNAVSDEGMRLGMQNYLYDEDRWPSGTAGGYVTMDPALRLHHMKLDVLPLDGTLSLPDTLAAASLPRLMVYLLKGGPALCDRICQNRCASSRPPGTLRSQGRDGCLYPDRADYYRPARSEHLPFLLCVLLT